MNWFVNLKILLIIALTIPGACNKKPAGKSGNYQALIAGTWELRKSSAAMVPGEKVYPLGNGNILKFDNGQYERYVNGALIKTGQYEIVSDNTVDQSVCLEMPDGQFTNRIIYDTDTTGEKIFIQVSMNRLVFISGCYALDGGHSSEYERQNSVH